jgi:hypothetical protein
MDGEHIRTDTGTSCSRYSSSTRTCIVLSEVRWGTWNSSWNVSMLTGTDSYLVCSACKILSLFGVTYKTGFGLYDWICCTLYIHTTLDYRQYNAVTHALVLSAFTNSIQARDVQQSHCNFKLHMKSSLSNQFLCSQTHILAGWRLETRLFTLCSSIKFFFIITLHGPRGKHHILVFSVFAEPSYSNGRGADRIENWLLLRRVFHGHVSIESSDLFG